MFSSLMLWAMLGQKKEITWTYIGFHILPYLLHQLRQLGMVFHTHELLINSQHEFLLPAVRPMSASTVPRKRGV
jgi:hypothetical protein